MLSRRLQRRGYCVVTAEDGEKGLSLARSEAPDIILMDISLPAMDGWEVTRLLKANMSTRHIPIIALTAHAMVSDRNKAIAAGAMTTTPSRSILASERKNRKSDTREETVMKPRTSRLLIVDDNEMNRDMLARRLARQRL